MAASALNPSSGKITSGIKPNTFIEKTIDFIEQQLPAWRDDKSRPSAEAEEELNAQLCKFLNDKARDCFPMASFNHEEKQGKRRRVDMSASPTTKAIEAALYDSIYVPYLVMEGKRLPAPSHDREHEYVTGGEKKSGGIQRFRLGLHGQLLKAAVIIAYIQNQKVPDWLKTINQWVSEYKTTKADKTCTWTERDHLDGLIDGGKNASRCESQHSRKNIKSAIKLVHLWICMSKKPVA